MDQSKVNLSRLVRHKDGGRGDSTSPLLKTGVANHSAILVHRCSYFGYASSGELYQFRVSDAISLPKYVGNSNARKARRVVSFFDFHVGYKGDGSCVGCCMWHSSHCVNRLSSLFFDVLSVSSQIWINERPRRVDPSFGIHRTK